VFGPGSLGDVVMFLPCERFQWRVVAEKLGSVLLTVMKGRG
jgi:hypothetical protein